MPIPTNAAPPSATPIHPAAPTATRRALRVAPAASWLRRKRFTVWRDDEPHGARLTGHEIDLLLRDFAADMRAHDVAPRIAIERRADERRGERLAVDGDLERVGRVSTDGDVDHQMRDAWCEPRRCGGSVRVPTRIFRIVREIHRALQLEPRASRGRPAPRRLFALGCISERTERARKERVRLFEQRRRARAIARGAKLTTALEEILRVRLRVRARARRKKREGESDPCRVAHAHDVHSILSQKG